MSTRDTWGHSIEILGHVARAWLRAGTQHAYLLRYTKRINRHYTKLVNQPATPAQAKAFARRYNLDLPVIDQDDQAPSLITPRPPKAPSA